MNSWIFYSLSLLFLLSTDVSQAGNKVIYYEDEAAEKAGEDNESDKGGPYFEEPKKEKPKPTPSLKPEPTPIPTPSPEIGSRDIPYEKDTAHFGETMTVPMNNKIEGSPNLPEEADDKAPAPTIK